MKYFLLIFFLLITALSNAQSNYTKQFAMNIAHSFNGSGDMTGFAFNTSYRAYFKSRLSWEGSIGATIHDGQYPIFYQNPSGNTIDESVRFTTAGVQALGGIGYSFLKKAAHELRIQTAALLRYQSSSLYDEINVLYPAGTGLPNPVVYFVNKTPQRTFAVGGSAELEYNYTLRKGICLGVSGSLQTDTNGDTISSFGIVIGKRF